MNLCYTRLFFFYKTEREQTSYTCHLSQRYLIKTTNFCVGPWPQIVSFCPLRWKIVSASWPNVFSYVKIFYFLFFSLLNSLFSILQFMWCPWTSGPASTVRLFSILSTVIIILRYLNKVWCKDDRNVLARYCTFTTLCTCDNPAYLLSLILLEQDN